MHEENLGQTFNQRPGSELVTGDARVAGVVPEELFLLLEGFGNRDLVDDVLLAPVFHSDVAEGEPDVFVQQKFARVRALADDVYFRDDPQRPNSFPIPVAGQFK